MKRADLLWFLVISVCILLFFRLVHGPIVTSPNAFLFMDYGDGIRNYYVTADHIKNDSSYWHNGGLNYPYGDHTVYSDAMPLFSNTVKLLSGVFPGLNRCSVGLQNLFVLGSFPLGAFFLYLVFRDLGLNRLFSALGGMAIILLSPQAWRLAWMPGLSIAFYFPMAIFFFCRYFRAAKKLKWSLVTGVFLTAVFFLHAYVGLTLAVSFFFLVSFSHFNESLSTRNLLPMISDLLIQVAGPVLVFMAFVNFTDHHGPRLNTPDGFFEMTSTFQTIFARYGEHPFAGFQALFPNGGKFAMDAHWEGWAYVGFMTSLILCFSLLKFGKKIWRKQQKRLVLDRSLNILMWSGVMVLLVSAGFPFSLHPSLAEQSESIPFVRQFRSLGRLAYFFYYVSGVFTVYCLFLFFRNLCISGKPVFGYLAFLSGIIIIGIEGVDLHLDIAQENGVKRNGFSREILKDDEWFGFLDEALNAVDPSEYQAIVPIPFFYTGGDIVLPPSVYSRDQFKTSLLFSYHSGLPLTGNYSTRIPVYETLSALQFFSHSWFRKSLLDDLPDHRPLLLLSLKGEKIHSQEAAILRTGQTVFTNERVILKSVSIDSLRQDRSSEVFQYFSQKRDSFLWNGSRQWFSDIENPLIFYENFDSLQSRYIFEGSGALEVPHFERTLLVPFDKIRLTEEEELTVSFWVETGENRLQLKIISGIADEHPPVRNERIIKNATRSFDISGNWIRFEFNIDPSGMSENESIYIKGEHKNQVKFIDELWVQKKGSSVFRIKTGSEGDFLWWNNFLVGKLPDSFYTE